MSGLAEVFVLPLRLCDCEYVGLLDEYSICFAPSTLLQNTSPSAYLIIDAPACFV